jgi:hypothetical protein
MSVLSNGNLVKLKEKYGNAEVFVSDDLPWRPGIGLIGKTVTLRQRNAGILLEQKSIQKGNWPSQITYCKILLPEGVGWLSASWLENVDLI